MTNDSRLDDYLTKLERLLMLFSVSDRAEIILEIKSHVHSALARDPNTQMDSILSALGEPEFVANRYLMERGMKPAKPEAMGLIANKSYASVSKRLLAKVLDTLLIFIPIAIVGNVLPIVGGFIALFLYYPIFESSVLRGTPGKVWAGIQVVDLQGRRVSFQAAVIRHLVSYASAAIACIGYVMAFFTERKQTLHDLVAETVVVYGRDEHTFASAWTDSFKEAVGSKSFQDSENSVSKLERLQKLKESGTLTEEEFQKEKRKILGE